MLLSTLAPVGGQNQHHQHSHSKYLFIRIHALLQLCRSSTITPRIAPCRPDPLARLLVLLLDNKLSLAKVDPVIALVHLDLVAHRPELIDDSVGYTVLERDRAVPPLDVVHALWARPANQEPRGVQRCLGVVPVVDEVTAVSP